MRSYVVVVNDCAAIAVQGGPLAVRSRDTTFGRKNFIFGFQALAAGLCRTLTDRELDWTETAGHLMAVDLACERARDELEWTRTIQAHLPVREPDYWNGLASRLAFILSEFTGDDFHLSFHAADHPESAPRQRQAPFPDHDCVALLSGGVDSFVGIGHLIDLGLRPLAVSHTAAGSISHAQSEVEQILRVRHSSLERIGITARKTGNFPAQEPSQRARSFMFLAVAALAATVDGSNRVFINENGIMAIHLPMTSARIGSYSTHTASPQILEHVQALARDVLGSPVTIENELLGLTKPEVVGLGSRLGLSAGLGATVSCWSIGRTSVHCGVCVPCIMRRVSFELHTVPDAAYTADIFEDQASLSSSFAIDNLTHLIQHLSVLQGETDLGLQIEYPELLNGGAALPMAETIQLHRRWADEAAGVLLAHSVPRSLW